MKFTVILCDKILTHATTHQTHSIGNPDIRLSSRHVHAPKPCQPSHIHSRAPLGCLGMPTAHKPCNFVSFAIVMPWVHSSLACSGVHLWTHLASLSCIGQPPELSHALDTLTRVCLSLIICPITYILQQNIVILHLDFQK